MNLPRASPPGSGCGPGSLAQNPECPVHGLCIGEQDREVGFNQHQVRSRSGAPGSGKVAVSGSRNTVAASSKDMACLVKLAAALRASHSKVTLAVYLMASTIADNHTSMDSLGRNVRAPRAERARGTSHSPASALRTTAGSLAMTLR